jgi:dolichyl-phosphate beta-glucosyltransferase
MSLLLSVVIPAYNEETRLGETLERMVSYLTGRGMEFELIVVDDHSSDGTPQLVEEFGRARGCGDLVRLLINSENRGKGYSVRRGMLEAHAPFALMSDADQSAPIEELERLEPHVFQGESDIAFGSRDLTGSVVALRQSWFRENSGKMFNRMVRLITGLPYSDTQCGFKLFRMSACRQLFEAQTIEGYSFDVELLYIARRWGLRVAEVPIVWRHSGGSKVRLFRDAPRMLLELTTIRARAARGVYAARSGLE